VLPKLTLGKSIIKMHKIKNLLINIIFYFLKEGSPTPVASKPPSTAKI